MLKIRNGFAGTKWFKKELNIKVKKINSFWV